MKKILLTLTLLASLTFACAQSAPPPAPTVAPAPTNIPIIPTIAPTSTAETASWQGLLQQAQTSSPERYQYTIEQGAQILPTPDGKSFYVLWLPEGSDSSNPPPIIVNLHGHAGWAFDGLFLWHSYAKERGYGILSLQWWFGGGEDMNDYYLPEEIYPLIGNILNENHVQPQSALLHGFSRGSTNTYGLTALDRASGNNFFLLTIANAGGAADDFPINQSIANGAFGSEPFAQTRWVMVCGMKDPNPDRDGCPAMRKTRDWVTQYGGTVNLLIEDPNGNHGAFHLNPENVNAALDVFAQLLKQ